MATIKELEDGIKKLNDDLQELKAKRNNRRWDPEHGDVYYYIYSDLSVSPTENYEHRHDKNRILVGNCYETKADAEKERDRMVAIAEVNRIIREENGDWVPDWNDHSKDKFTLTFCHARRGLMFYSVTTWQIETVLEYCSDKKLKVIISRITQDQINKIWRL